MEETLITWNVPNMVTIVFMCVIGFAIIGVVGNLFTKFTNKQAA